MPNAHHTPSRIAGLSFALLMTLAVDGAMLWRMDTIAQEGAQAQALAAANRPQLTLPTVVVRARQA